MYFCELLFGSEKKDELPTPYPRQVQLRHLLMKQIVSSKLRLKPVDLEQTYTVNVRQTKKRRKLHSQHGG